MHSRKLFFAVIVLMIATFSVGLRGQGLVDGIKVTLPHPVTLDDKVLAPGEYEIRRASQFQPQVLRIFSNDKMVYETHVLTVPTGADKNPDDTKVILHHIGNNYYFDRIFMEDKDYGYEFPLPERAKALQRELAVNVPARYESLPQTAQPEQPQVGLSAQLDAVAAQDARDRQSELDRQAELAQLERDRVAALQIDPVPVAPSQSDAQPAPQQTAAIQSDAGIPAQLPRTATNWVAFVIGGIFLLMLSLFVRPATQG